jgi:hypothetical protein
MSSNFNNAKIINVYYNKGDRKPYDVNGKPIAYIGEEAIGATEATTIRFYLGEDLDSSTAVIVTKRPDGERRLDLCEKFGTGVNSYYQVTLNAWYGAVKGKATLAFKVYNGEVEFDDEETPTEIISVEGRIVVSDIFNLEIAYAPEADLIVPADDTPDYVEWFAALSTKLDKAQSITVTGALPTLTGDVYDDRYFYVENEGTGRLYYINGSTAIEVVWQIGTLKLTPTGNGNNTADTGKLSWNQPNGTVNVGLYNDVNIGVGEDVIYYVKATGAITKGDVIQYAGFQGDHALAKRAVQSEVNANPKLIMGIAKQNIANGEFGYVAHFGKLEDVDTKSQAVNSFVWFDSAGSTAGNWTTTQPTAPNAKILLAVIIKAESSSNANNGVILVRPTIEPKISELQDVNLSSLTNGDVLIYDETLDSGGNSINRWKNSSLLSKHELDIVNIFNGTNVLTETPTPVGRSVADQYGNEIFSVYLSKDGANDLYFTKSFLNENFVTYVGGSSFFVSISQRGQPNGIASLGGDGRVPPSQLPASIGEILEFETFEEFPFEGTAERIYIAKDTNITYRWSGTQYVEISQSLALGETSESAYRGDRGKIAYDHSQIVTGNPHGTTATDIGAEPANANIQSHILSTSNPHGVTVGQIGAEPANANIQAHVTLTNGSNPHQTTFANIATKPTTLSGYGITDALTSTQISSTYIPLTQKGAVSGVATLDSNSKIPVAQLPNSVFDSLFYFESMNVTNVNSSSEKREIIVDRLLDGLKVANFDRNRGIAGFYFVISGGGTIADVTGLRADNLDNDHPYEDSYATLRFKVQDGATGATGTGPNTGFSTSSGVLEIGDWFVIESVTGLGTEASPFIFTAAVVNNTYELATTALNGIVRLSSRTTYAGLTGNNVVTEGVLKTTVDNAGFAVASNYLPLTGGNITGNLNVSGTFSSSTQQIIGSSTGNTTYSLYRNDATNVAILGHDASITGLSDGFGVFVYGDKPLDFSTNSAKRMTITGAGNVGIGTTSPLSKLTVNGDIAIPYGSSIKAYNSSNNTFYTNSELLKSFYDGTTDNDVTSISSPGQINSHLRFLTGIAGARTEKVRINSAGNVGIGTAGASEKLTIQEGNIKLYSGQFLNNDYRYIGTEFGFGNGNNKAEIRFAIDGIDTKTRIQFHTANGTANIDERMRITSGGDVLIGTTTVYRFGLNVQTSSAGQIALRHSSQTAGRFWYLGVEGSNDVFTVYADTGFGVYMSRGDTAWSANSDERLKTDLIPITDALNKLNTLRTVTGRYKKDEIGKSRSFLLAQDVLKVFPEAVDIKDDEDKTLGLRYSELVPLLVKAIQELKTELDELKAKFG